MASHDIEKYHKDKKYRKKRIAGVLRCQNKARTDLDSTAWFTRTRGGLRLRAVRKGISFDLTLQDIRQLYCEGTQCAVCQKKLERATVGSRGSHCRRENIQTVDRIDNSRGYVRGNVWIICGRCNRLKSDSSPEELLLIAHAVQARLRSPPTT